MKLELKIVQNLQLPDCENQKEEESEDDDGLLLIGPGQRPLPRRNPGLIENEVEGKLPLVLFGDERRIKQVLINLVKNAKKFTEKGKIQIKASYNEQVQSLVVHVNDTGVGISAEDLPKLFNRFGKLQRTA